MGQTIGIIGGSGLYDIEGFIEAEDVPLETPYGSPSSPLRVGRIGDSQVVFLPRHGAGHTFSPTDIPYQANIYAMKSLGVDAILSVSAVGSLHEDLPPGTMVLIDQFIDRTTSRPRTFFDRGAAAHVAFGDPICPVFAQTVASAAESAQLDVVRGGTYVCIEGPQFSTRAESELFRSWGATIIGMTNLPEARLAREAEIPYATLALVTDFDCWHREHDDVTVEQVITTLKANVSKAKALIVSLAETPLGDLSQSPAAGALQYALMTQPSHISAVDKERIGLFMSPYWEGK